jgi:hypothetical protein
MTIVIRDPNDRLLSHLTTNWEQAEAHVQPHCFAPGEHSIEMTSGAGQCALTRFTVRDLPDGEQEFEVRLP